VEEKRTVAEMTADLTQRTTWKGRSVRALNPLAKAEAQLLAAVGRGEFLIHGFRNRDIRDILYGVTEDAAVQKTAQKSSRSCAGSGGACGGSR
jgi:hypothetical protein